MKNFYSFLLPGHILKASVLLFLLLPFNKLHSQQWEWGRGASSTFDDLGRGISCDDNGNVITCGEFAVNPINFGNDTLQSNGNVDFFVAKHDASGNPLWAVSGGGSDREEAREVDVDPMGNIHIAGYIYSDTVYIDDDTLYREGNDDFDFFVAKYDNMGNKVFTASGGGRRGDGALDVSSDPFGNTYTTGFFESDTIFIGNDTLIKPGPISTVSNDFFIAKYDPVGNLNWTKQGNHNSLMGRAIDCDDNGNIILGGRFGNDTLILGNDTLYNSIAFVSFFLAKLDSSGNYIWARTGVSGNNDWNEINDISTDSSGNIYVTGSLNGSLTIDGVTIYGGFSGYNAFIAKFDPQGNLEWADYFGGSDWENGYGISVNDKNRVVVTGRFDSPSFQLGGKTINNKNNDSSHDIFVAVYDTSGNITGGFSHGSIYEDEGRDITTGPDNEAYCTGFYEGDSLIFDQDTVYNASWYSSGIYIAKINCLQNFSKSLSAVNVCEGDSVMIFGNYEKTAGIYYDSLQSVKGCDSIISRELIVDSTYFVQMPGQEICSGDSILIFGSYENTSGIYYDSLQTVAGCDSVFSINLTVNPNTSTTKNITTCDSYTVPSGDETYFSGGTYMDTIPNTMGCDSVLTINLTINTVDTSVVKSGHTLTANQSGGSYNWMDCSTGNLVSGANSQSFTPSTNGSYAAVVTYNGCTDTSFCYTVTGVGVKGYTLQNNFKVYPNPASDKVFIELQYVYDKVEVVLQDLKGRRVSKAVSSTNSEIVEFPLEGTPGLYFIKVYSGGRLIGVEKVVVE